MNEIKIDKTQRANQRRLIIIYMLSVKKFFTLNIEKVAKNMIKLSCDKPGDSRILLVENKFLNIHCQTCYSAILFTKTTAAQKEDALSYHSVRGQHFVAAVFVRSIAITF